MPSKRNYTQVKEGKILDNLSESVSNIGTKVKDGSIVQDMSTGMTSFASKVQNASAKGWKDFSSMFSDKQTTLSSAEGGPSEGTSLLGGGGMRGKSAFSDNDKPLLENSPDREDSWEGWGESWGKADSPTTESPSKATESPSKAKAEEDGWASWNTDAPSAPSSKAQKQPKPKKEEDSWLNEDWGGFNDSSKAETSKSSKSKSSHKKAKSKSSAKSSEPATANLIDFGAEGGGAAEQGWDNEVWAQDKDDDAWETLELEASSGQQKAPQGRSKKGD